MAADSTSWRTSTRLAQTARWHRVAHAAPLDLGDGHVHPAGLDIGRVEAPARQGAEQRRLDDESLGRERAHAAVQPGVDALVEPAAARSLSSAMLSGGPSGLALLQEPFLHVPEGPLHLALALGVPGLAGPDLGPWNWAKSAAGGWRVKRRPWDWPSAPMRSVRATLGTPPTDSKNADQSLEGVLPVDRGGEPPDPHRRPAQDGREALDLAQSPFPGPVRHVGPVELALLTRCGHDPRRAPGRRLNRGPADGVQVPGHAHIGAAHSPRP